MVSPLHPTTSLTLTVGGVSFTLAPESVTGTFRVESIQDEYVIYLDAFQGSLRVSKNVEAASNATKITPKASNKKKLAPRKAPIIKRSKSTSSAPANTANETMEHDGDGSNNNSTAWNKQEPATKKVRLESSSSSTLSQYSQYSQTTLLGQPDFSQTQETFASSDNKQECGDCYCGSNDQDLEHAPRVTSSRVQEMLDASNFTQPSVTKDDDADADFDDVDADGDHGVVQDKASVDKSAARISLGTSPLSAARAVDSIPGPRWGHTMTKIGQDRLLLYGGQTFDSETNLPVTLKDLFVYNITDKSWFKPFGCEAMKRQWHSSTFLKEKNLVITFGGEAIKGSKTKTTDQVMVFDTEIMLWYPPTVSGEIPSGRSGHTATILPATNELVVFGGVKGSKWLNTVSVLDTSHWIWSAPKVQGVAPKPRSYHTASVVADNKIVVFGGNGCEDSFNSVHLLECEEGTWRWTNPDVMGYKPSPRTGHSATVLSDNTTICIYGGWDPNDEDVVKADEIHSDCFFLDTIKWNWKKGPKAMYADLPAEVHGIDGGPARVGHEAALIGDNEVLVFGGRIPRDRFAGDFQSISVPSSFYKYQ
jgi:N-acetylneuraminic acid mutarotase